MGNICLSAERERERESGNGYMREVDGTGVWMVAFELLPNACVSLLFLRSGIYFLVNRGYKFTV